MDKRLHYCLNNISNSFENVIFSDEKQFVNDPGSGSGYTWVSKTGEKDIKTVFHGTTSRKLHAMVWGCFSLQKGPSPLYIISGPQNSERYIKRLEHVTNYIDSHTNGIFMQDNCAYHVADNTLEWMKSNRAHWKILRWPPHSPDFNPIEYVWASMVTYLKQRVCGAIPPSVQSARLCFFL